MRITPMKLSTRNISWEIVFILVLLCALFANGQLIPCYLSPCKNGGSCFPVQSIETNYGCSCTEEFTGQNCTELSFKARIGILEIERYLPGITSVPADMTNSNARRVGTSVTLSVGLAPLSEPLTYKWKVNGTTLNLTASNRYTLLQNGRLGIISGSLAEEGLYQLFISNEFGTLFSRKIRLKFAVIGNLLSTNTPINVSMVEGEPYLLRCPPRTYSYGVKYDWQAIVLKSSISNNLLYAPRILMEPNGDLLFSSVERSDFNTFINPLVSLPWSSIQCRVNFFGPTSFSMIVPDIYFYVTGNKNPLQSTAFKFYTKPQGLYNLITGDQFYVNCTVGGRPIPRIQWYRNDKLISDSGDLFQHHRHNRTLRLGSLNSTSHDGTYKCEAMSGLRKEVASFHIKVMDKVTALYSSPFDRHDIRAGKYGQSVLMVCNTTGHPILSRTWYYNGVELKYRKEFANRWSVDPLDGTLEIRNLQLTDFGFYQCLAKNALTEGDRKTFLVVTGSPLPPINVTTTNCWNQTTNLSWAMRLTPDLPPPLTFIIETRAKIANSRSPWPAFSKLAVISDGSTRSYVVKHLRPYNEIQFRVRATNQIGTGFPGLLKTSCNTRSQTPSLFPKNLRTIGTGSDGRLSMSWKPLDPVNWSGDNCAYRIFYRLSAPNETWNNLTKVFGDCSRSFRSINGLRPNSEYEVAIRAENSQGPGPSSPVIRVLSEQRRPSLPTSVNVIRVDSSSVELGWSEIKVTAPKTVDGYLIFAMEGVPKPDSGREEEEQLERRVARNVDVLPHNVLIPNGTIYVHVNTSLTGVVRGLKSFTTYMVSVAGYNNNGMGRSNMQTVTTLDTRDSYYILSLRITSETYTEELKDESSSKFINLKRNLITEMSSLYQGHPWFKRASLLSLRPGSVQADFQLEVANPNRSIVLDVVSVMDNLGNFSLDRNETKIKSEQGIESVTVSASSLLLNVSDKVVINCTVIGGPDDLNIMWFKANKVIGLTNRTKVETSLRRSLLTIRDVVAEDEGNYTCVASKGIQNRTSSIIIGVIPVLSIQPRGISKRVGDQATFECKVVSGFRQGARVSVVEVTNKANEVRHQTSNFTAVNLQIPEGVESYTRIFVCEMWLQQKLLSRGETAELIIIPPDAPKCPAELLEGVSWAATAAGGTDIQPCPKGASGTASRECSEKATWKTASYIRCSSLEFTRLANEIEALTEGFQTETDAREILSQLANVSQPVTNNSRRPTTIYGGDLVIAVRVLVSLTELNVDQGNVSSDEDFDNYAQVASNLLQSTNSETWRKLGQAGQGRSQTFLKTVDNYGLGIAATLTGSTKSRTVQKENLLITIKRVDQDSPVKTEGLTVSYQQSSIFLPPEAFPAKKSRVVSVVYLTLRDILPLTRDKKQDAPVSPNTTVVSSTVLPRPPDNLNNPVKIILQNRGVSVPSGVTPQAECVFWRPGEFPKWKTRGCRLVSSESDVTMTTCECDHLTIFASLMDPFESSIGEADKKALEIISIVGCAISLLAVVITIVVTLFFWRVVKSPRAKVLLNVCAAIALICIFVISEGSARGNKAGCTVIAVLLHYFLLALFSWMLCEGVLLYYLLVKVFGGEVEDKVKYFYLFGWGFPAIIVIISLAATQTDGYGSPHACWLDVTSGLIWAFIAPALIIILVNIAVFVLVIRQMMGTRHVQSKTQIEKVKAGIKASAVILPLLGITWLFGLLSFSSGTVAFKYIFAIFNSLQGLMIFVFHCLLNKQIKDAIKRRRDKNSSAVVSSTPKTKPSPNTQAKHAVKPQGKAPKKWSNRAQNDYEMMGNVESDRKISVSTLPTKSIIDIPDEKLPEVITSLKDAPEKLNGDEKSIPVDDGSAAVDDYKGFAEYSAETNEQTRQASQQGSSCGEEEVPRYKVSIDGVTNHTYGMTPEEYAPIEEVNKGSEAASLSSKESSPSTSDSEEEAVELDSVVHPKSKENSVDGKTSLDALILSTEAIETNETRAVEKLVPEYTRSIDHTPAGGSFFEKPNRESETTRVSPKESLSSSSTDSEEEPGEFNSDATPGNVSCVLEEATLEGALPSSSLEESPAYLTTKKVQPREFDDDLKNDEDFEIKMKERRIKVDTLQSVAEAFTGVNLQTSPSKGPWEKIRQKIHRGSYKVTLPGGIHDSNPESHKADVENLELV